MSRETVNLEHFDKAATGSEPVDLIRRAVNMHYFRTRQGLARHDADSFLRELAAVLDDVLERGLSGEELKRRLGAIL